MKWYAGSDHAGLRLKRHLVTMLHELGDQVIDVGTTGEASVDYPEFGAETARRVVADPEALGLVVCGSGIGISIAANKVPGARAALVHDGFTAEMARLHTNANIIAMGERVVGFGVAEHALAAFRGAKFEGGRHQRRIDLLSTLDRK